MHPASAHTAFRMRDPLESGPELTIILDSSGSPSSRMRAQFLAHGQNSIQIQLGAALGQNILVSIAGEVEQAPLSEVKQQEVDARLAGHRANPQAAIPWEQIEAEARARLRK